LTKAVKGVKELFLPKRRGKRKREVCGVLYRRGTPKEYSYMNHMMMDSMGLTVWVGGHFK